MTVAINHAREAIELQLEPLRQEATELEERLAAIKKSKTRLEAALKALAEPKATKSRKPSRPCAKKETVMKVCLSIVMDKGPISKADLQRLAKDKLTELGYSLGGFQLRIGECLASKDFTVTDDGLVSLAESHDSSTTSAPERKSRDKSPVQSDTTRARNLTVDEAG